MKKDGWCALHYLTIGLNLKCKPVSKLDFHVPWIYMSRDFLIDIKIYQEVDIDHCGCRHFPWGRRRASHVQDYVDVGKP